MRPGQEQPGGGREGWEEKYPWDLLADGNEWICEAGKDFEAELSPAAYICAARAAFGRRGLRLTARTLGGGRVSVRAVIPDDARFRAVRLGERIRHHRAQISRLSAERRSALRALREAGWTQQEIAGLLGVSEARVSVLLRKDR
jgi:DNA-directed RNA polymerase specialized sigma24 family protein